MAVISCKNFVRVGMGERIRSANRCSDCGGHLWYPFIHWRAEPERCLCSKCCIKLKAAITQHVQQANDALPGRSLADVEHFGIKASGGLIADVIECCAIQELQAAGYRDFTFVRMTIQELEAKEAAAGSQ